MPVETIQHSADLGVYGQASWMAGEMRKRDPFQEAAPCWQQEPVRLLECGCCGQFHPEGSFLPGGSANYLNDCRNDTNRFNSDEDFTERTGLLAVEVWLDEQAE